MLLGYPLRRIRTQRAENRYWPFSELAPSNCLRRAGWFRCEAFQAERMKLIAKSHRRPPGGRCHRHLSAWSGLGTDFSELDSHLNMSWNRRPSKGNGSRVCPRDEWPGGWPLPSGWLPAIGGRVRRSSLHR